jgi:HEAT repeat protein
MPLIRQQLASDSDPFVRRMAAKALAQERSAENANAIADFLERSMRDRDSASERAAQEALQQMAKTRGPRTLELWRKFAQSLATAPK